jgi:tRNA (adenine57-N1/adenine58-N1)-methyltransferase
MEGASVTPHGVFAVGDLVQLTDAKGRHYSIILEKEGRFHSHRGVIPHSAIVGLAEGSVVNTEAGTGFLALRPSLADFVLSMPRGAAIIYPKDASEILFRADIRPGLRVLEAGVGSGALTLWLLSALGDHGQLISVDRREDFAHIARGNVETYFHGQPSTPWDLRVGEVNEVFRDLRPHSLDRVILDMLAPWECIDQALDALVPGGTLLCYVATVTQLSRVMESIRASGRTNSPEATESLVRSWHVDGLAVRPNHRMIGHTGFLAWARVLAPGVVTPTPIGKKAKPDYSDADVEAWTPGAVGLRTETEKKLRQLGKDALSRAKRASSPDDDVADNEH